MRRLPRGQLPREVFEQWIVRNADRVQIEPFEIVPCACGDVNCHGWRLVGPVRERLPMAKATLSSSRRSLPELQYVPFEDAP